jgi:hypothetical protein
VAVASLAAEHGDTGAAEAKKQDGNPMPYRLNLLSMMEGMGAGYGKVIDVGLHWQYESATATSQITTPKMRVGTTSDAATTSLVHVEADAIKKAALITGGDDVELEVNSRNSKPIIGMSTGAHRWDISVPEKNAFHIGKQGMKATLKLEDGKLGIGTETGPKSALNLASNTKGDHIYFQGNYDGKTDGLMDSMITLESSQDYRGRGVFLPHRGGGAGSSTAWFAGVPNGGGGYQIGSSASHMTESQSGPYLKGQAHMFVANNGNVGFGHTNPETQVDIQLLAGNSDNADRALNIRGGSMNVDFGQGVYSGRVGMLFGENDYIQVGSNKKSEEREIRLATDEKNFVTVSRYNAYVGIGGVKDPTVPLDVQGNVKFSKGSLAMSMEPKDQEQMVVMNSDSTVPASIGFRQADKPYMSISGGKAGAVVELANGASMTVANGRFGIGADPTELFHVKGGDALLEGSSLWFKSKVSGTRIFEDNGLHLSGGVSGKILLDNSDVVVQNPGSNSVFEVLSDPTKEAAVQLTSGSDAWRAHTTSAGDGSLFFSHKGTRVAMTRRGELGVGIQSPSEALHVKGSAQFESSEKDVFATMKSSVETQAAGVRLTSGKEEWKVSTTATGGTDVSGGSLAFAHGANTHVVISKAGSLGVGTGAPLAGTSLHVKGPSMYDVGSSKGKVVISTPNGNPGMSFFDNAGYRRMDLEATAQGISFTSEAGFFGIGIQAPKSKLHVYDNTNTAITLSRSGKSASEAYLKYAGPYMRIGTAAADGLQFDINGQPKMTVHPTGNVGVHTDKPVSQLQVGKTAHVFTAGQFSVFSGNAFFDGAKYKYTTSGAAGKVEISSEGSVGIYTAAPGSANVEVAQFDKAALMVTNNGFVGVGVQAPEANLHVTSTTEATVKQNGILMLGAGQGTKNIAMDGKSIVARNNGQTSALRLNPEGGDVTFFADSGKVGHKTTFGDDGLVGFGPAKPLAKLHVSEGPGAFTTIGLGESETGIGVIRWKQSKMTLGFSKSASGATNIEDGVVITKHGYVGIGGESDPKANLHVKGDVLVSGKLNVGGKQIVSMMESLMEENKAMKMELAATKEMLMSMRSEMKEMMQSKA